MDLLKKAKIRFNQILIENDLLNEEIEVSVRGLTSNEAIGVTERKDFPIIEGKEVMIEAEFRDSYGQAFTDAPNEYKGTLKELINLPLSENKNRAVFIAVLNSVLRNLGFAQKTSHCKNEEPENCSKELIDWLCDKNISGKIGLVGYQPAMLESLSGYFKPENILISDLNLKNINEMKFGVKVLNGKIENFRLIDNSDYVLLTGSTIVNGSINNLYEYLEDNKKKYSFFGNTISGVAKLIGLPHICFYGR
ncbi:MAG: DUF364 domain-containing protein [Clostridiales bacterium]